MLENMFGISVSRFRILLTTIKQRPKVVRHIIFTCVVSYNMLRTHQGGADRASIPGNDVSTLQKTTSFMWGVLAGQRDKV